MYLFFNINEYFFALNTGLVKRVNVYIPDSTENDRVVVDDIEYELYEGKIFFKLTKLKEYPKKNIIFINSKGGYHYGVIVDTVAGFFDIDKIKVINKTNLLNKYGYQYIDFAVDMVDKLIFVFFDEFFDERFKELTCQR